MSRDVVCAGVDVVCELGCTLTKAYSLTCVFLFFFSGFSRQMVAILQEMGAEFSAFNIIMDEEVREGV